MIGIFDSGVGGLCSFAELRRLLPRADILYLADRKNAPYGTKSREELLCLVRRDIQRLRAMGATEILVACCTASMICPLLDGEETSGLTTMILPTAEHIASEKSENPRVAVIATRATVDSGEFGKAIKRLVRGAEVTEIALQPLVSIVESGARDGCLSGGAADYLDGALAKVREGGFTHLVLGCTHFSHLAREIEKRLPQTRIVSPARLGALAIYEKIKSKELKSGFGRSLYTE